jgi:hypothetical protein
MILRIAPRSTAPPALPSDGSPSVQEWRLSDGTIWAYGHVIDGERWLHLPGIASYHLPEGHGAVTAFPASGASDETVRDSYRRIVVPISFQAQGGEVVHASAVRFDGGVVAFCADSQGGKSTTAYGMSRRGHDLWADDAVALDFSGSAIQAVPLPFVVRLRPPSAQLFFGVERTADHRPEAATALAPPSEPAPLVAVFFLSRHLDTDSAPVVRPVPATNAFERVLRQAGCFTLQDPERKKLMIEQYLELSAVVPFYELGIPADLSRLEEVLDCVETALAIERSASPARPAKVRHAAQ